MIPVSAIIGLGQTAFGAYQQFKAQQLAKKNVMPEYQIPDEVTAKLSMAQRQALEGLPAEQKQQFVQNLQRSTNFGLQALNERKSGIAGVSALQQNLNDSYSDLLSKDAAARQANIAKLGEVQSEMAGQKLNQFGMNKLKPYEAASTAVGTLGQSGIQNIGGGIMGAAKGFEQQAYLKELKDAYGGNKSGLADTLSKEGEAADKDEYSAYKASHPNANLSFEDYLKNFKIKRNVK